MQRVRDHLLQSGFARTWEDDSNPAIEVRLVSGVPGRHVTSVQFERYRPPEDWDIKRTDSWLLQEGFTRTDNRQDHLEHIPR